MTKIAMAFVLALTLGGCSIDPNASWAPEILKAEKAPAAPPEAPPDIRAMLVSKLPEFFLPAAGATNLSFSIPRRGTLDWTTCVRATVNGATGGSIGQQTYLFNISRNSVARQEHVGASHFCEGEAYQKL